MKVAVLGATGFTGEKLVEILLAHPKVELCYLASRTKKAVLYSKFFSHFSKKTKLKCEPLDLSKAAKGSDILFLSLPHTVSMEFAPYLLKKGKKVIDLSADYRIKSPSLYKQYYGVVHKDVGNLRKAVYGLAEIYKAKIKNANLIANPGCYPTSIILGLFPLVKEGLIKGKIVVDSKSSITGAGRRAAKEYYSSGASTGLWAYKPFVHQHTPEILGVLKDKTNKSINLCFTPHVVNAESGIYSTIYLELKKKLTLFKINSIYKKHYKGCPFVRISKGLPKLANVVGTNFCDIGFALDSSGKNAVVVSCIDNLIKGAAGAAVQNMNIMLGYKQTMGLL